LPVIVDYHWPQFVTKPIPKVRSNGDMVEFTIWCINRWDCKREVQDSQ